MKSLRIEKLKSLSLAALLMAGTVFTACSSSDDIIEQTVNPTKTNGQQVYTMVVKATKGDATTRGLSLNGKTLNVKWYEGEVVKVVQQNDDAPYDFKEIGTLTAAASSNGETTLTGTLTQAPTHKRDISFYLHDINMVYTGQTGQLLKPASGTDNSIETKYDYAMATARWDVSGEFSVDEENHTVSVPGGLTFNGQQAIVKFTLVEKADGTTPIKPTSLTINDTYTTGSISVPNIYQIVPNIYQIKNLTTDPQTFEQGPLTLTLDGTNNEIYVAISQSMNLQQFSYNFTLTATDAEGNVYTYTKDDVIFDKGQYYEVKVNMTMTAAAEEWNGNLAKIPTYYLESDYKTLKVKDGMTLYGTLDKNYKIMIEDDATVTLNNAIINGVNNQDYNWAGITCEGDATIILADGSTNTVTAFYEDYPGIFVPEDGTLTIQGGTKGNGKLMAGSENSCAGIGGAYHWESGHDEFNGGDVIIEGGDITAKGWNVGIGGCNMYNFDDITIKGGTVKAMCVGENGAGIGSGSGSCGYITITGGNVEATGGEDGAGIGSGDEGECCDITIRGGTVTATGGENGAGIGTGYEGNCGYITISGGTVTATGGENGAGIGTGYEGNCGYITISGGTVTAKGGLYGAGIGTGDDGKCRDIFISSGVTKVTATKGAEAPHSIGKGDGDNTSCGTVIIGCTFDSDGNPVGGTTGVISESPYTYRP